MCGKEGERGGTRPQRFTYLGLHGPILRHVMGIMNVRLDRWSLVSDQSEAKMRFEPLLFLDVRRAILCPQSLRWFAMK